MDVKVHIAFDVDVPSGVEWPTRVVDLAQQIADADEIAVTEVELVEALFRTVMYDIGLIPRCLTDRGIRFPDDASFLMDGGLA